MITGKNTAIATSAILEASPKPNASSKQRHQRDLRDREQRRDQRIDENANRPEHRHQKADRDAGNAAEEEAGEHAIERHAGVLRELAA